MYMKTKIPYFLSVILIIPLYVMLFLVSPSDAGNIIAPPWLSAVCVLLSVVTFVLFILNLVADKNEDAGIKDRAGSVILRYSFFMLVVTLIQLLISNIIARLPIEISPTAKSTISFLMIVLSFDVIGFPLLLFLLKKIPSNPVAKKKIGFPGYLAYILMTAGLVGVGAIAGAVVHRIICAPFGGASSEIQKILMNSAPLPRILVAGILAPVFEELVFRKLLIDRLNKYGAFFAIMVSGLTFGLFHGNFQQVFFATLIGFIFAQLYLKTGRVELTIGLHMIVNLTTTVVTNTLLQKLYQVNPDLNSSPEFLNANPEIAMLFGIYGLWIMFLGTVVIAGCIILIVFLAKKKFVLDQTEDTPSKSEAVKAFLTNRYSVLFLLIIVGLFLLSYLPVVFKW